MYIKQDVQDIILSEIEHLFGSLAKRQLVTREELKLTTEGQKIIQIKGYIRIIKLNPCYGNTERDSRLDRK